jgi:hypothetical protein
VIQPVKTVIVEEKDLPLLSKLREPELLEDQVKILVTVKFKPHLPLNLIQILIQVLLIQLQNMDVIFLLSTNPQQILLILQDKEVKLLLGMICLLTLTILEKKVISKM